MADKPFRIVGGKATAAEGAPTPPDTRTREEKLQAFFGEIIALSPHTITCIVEVTDHHEIRSFPNYDSVDIGNILIAWTTIRDILHSREYNDSEVES